MQSERKDSPFPDTALWLPARDARRARHGPVAAKLLLPARSARSRHSFSRRLASPPPRRSCRRALRLRKEGAVGRLVLMARKAQAKSRSRPCSGRGSGGTTVFGIRCGVGFGLVRPVLPRSGRCRPGLLVLVDEGRRHCSAGESRLRISSVDLFVHPGLLRICISTIQDTCQDLPGLVRD